MARIVHTADVHLDPAAPERTEALATVLDRAEAADADAVTIGGDCFEDDTAAERLRPELRSLFADRPFPVLVIPGNHDRRAFEGDVYFGPTVRTVTAEPFEHVVVGEDDARITCVPYTPAADEELLVALRERDPFAGLECLLLHASLEAPLAGDSGEEADPRYCPVTRSELGALEFDVVLAGHYHQADRVDLPTDTAAPGTFVYPGSPASVTRGEQGRRSIAIVDEDATPTVGLDTVDAFHYDELVCRVRPGEAAAMLERIRERVGEWAERNVAASVTVEGFLDRQEDEFAAALADAAGEVPVENRTRSVSALLEHPIYEGVVDRLDVDAVREAARHPEAGDERRREALQEDARERVLAAMADLAAEGDLE